MTSKTSRRNLKRPSKRRSKHATLSPSGSKRWLVCTASPGFIEAHREELPPDEGSRYAQEGTDAHKYAEQLLNGMKRALPANPRNTEMIACVREGFVPFVLNEFKKLGEGARMFIEVKVNLFYDKKETGTADVVLVGRRKIVVIDLKYGQGISVEAKYNSQLAIYLESVIQRKWPSCKDKIPVEMIIYQPRAQDARFVRRWETTRGDLREFCEPIEATAVSIKEEPEKQKFKADADNQCRHCPAKAICGTYAAHLLEDTPTEVRRTLTPVEYRIGLPKVDSLTTFQLTRLLRIRNDFVNWFDEIEKVVTHRMTRGKKFEGLKLVSSKTNRQWDNEAKAQALLLERLEEEDLFKKTFISPSQAGKLLSSAKVKASKKFVKRVEALVTKPEGHPVIAPKEDPRPPIDLDPLEDFSDLPKSAKRLL